MKPMAEVSRSGTGSLSHLFCNIFPILKKGNKMSRGMGAAKMWYVRPAEAQISLRIRSV